MERGFTIVEILLVITILVMLGGITLIISANFYRQHSLYAEQTTLVNILRRARSEALNNYNQSSHGVYIGENEYTIFQGGSYAARNSGYDEVFLRGGGFIFSGLSEIIFQTLEGSANASGTIMMVNGTQTTTIAINGEGRITF